MSDFDPNQYSARARNRVVEHLREAALEHELAADKAGEHAPSTDMDSDYAQAAELFIHLADAVARDPQPDDTDAHQRGG